MVINIYTRQAIKSTLETMLCLIPLNLENTDLLDWDSHIQQAI